MANSGLTVGSVRKANAEFGVWRDSFRRAHDSWVSAPRDLKPALLLTGSGLVRAENWLMEYPDQLSESEKVFVIKSLSERPDVGNGRNKGLARARNRNLLKNLASNWVVWACVFVVTWLLTANDLRDAMKRNLEAGLSDPIPSSMPKAMARRIAAAKQGKAPSDLDAAQPNETPVSSEPTTTVAEAPQPAQSAEQPAQQTAGAAAPTTAPQQAEVQQPNAQEQRIARLKRLVALAGEAVDRGNQRLGLLLAIEAYEDVQKLAAEPAEAEPQPAELTTSVHDIMARASASIARALQTRTAVAGPLAVAAGKPSSAMCADGGTIVNALTANRLRTARISTQIGDNVDVQDLPSGRLLLKATAFSADCEAVVLAADEHVAELWSVKTGKRLSALPGHEATILAAALSRDGRMAITASQDATARLWDVASGRQLALLDQHDQQVISAAFSPDGRLALTASTDRTARIWDTASGRQLRVLGRHLAAVTEASFSPDGSRVLTSAWDGVARVWDAGTGQLLHSLKPADAVVMSAAYSPDGMRILTVSQNGAVHVWDAAAGTLSAALPRPPDPVRTLIISHDGKKLLTVTWNGQLILWDLDRAALETVLSGRDQRIEAAGFGNDDRLAMAMTQDGNLVTWPVGSDSADLVRLGKARVGQCLSEAERTSLGLEPRSAGWCTASVRTKTQFTSVRPSAPAGGGGL